MYLYHCNWRRDFWHECLAANFLLHHWEKLQMQSTGPCSMAYCWEWDNWSKRVYLNPLVIYLYLFGSGSCILQQCLLNVESAWFSEFFTSYERLKKVACENVSCAMPCEWFKQSYQTAESLSNGYQHHPFGLKDTKPFWISTILRSSVTSS